MGNQALTILVLISELLLLILKIWPPCRTQTSEDGSTLHSLIFPPRAIHSTSLSLIIGPILNMREPLTF